MNGTGERRWTGFFTVCAVAMVFLLIGSGLGLSLTAHSTYDSYTLQAMAWRDGTFIIRDGASLSWLELAIYRGDYYVSFPPFPSVVMLPLTWIFGSQTPTLCINLFMILCTAAFGFALLHRIGLETRRAATVAFFYVCGCNILIIMLRGGVWYTAQGMSMLLTTAFLYGINAPPGKNQRVAVGAALLCLALAVGCRPFQAVYVPYGLYKLYTRLGGEGEDDSPVCRMVRMIPYLILPLAVACAYGWYNWIRFGNPLEFGHNYLPEFTREGNQQFSLAHWPHNMQNILRMPAIEDGRLVFETLGPSALILVYPIFIISMIETIQRIIRKDLDAEDGILIASLMFHFNLLLLHRTLGGSQFGVRYMIDLMPTMLLLTFRKKKEVTCVDALLMLMGIAINVYGAITFYIPVIF